MHMSDAGQIVALLRTGTAWRTPISMRRVRAHPVQISRALLQFFLSLQPDESPRLGATQLPSWPVPL
jgi:hypothetical protein